MDYQKKKQLSEEELNEILSLDIVKLCEWLMQKDRIILLCNSLDKQPSEEKIIIEDWLSVREPEKVKNQLLSYCKLPYFKSKHSNIRQAAMRVINWANALAFLLSRVETTDQEKIQEQYVLLSKIK